MFENSTEEKLLSVEEGEGEPGMESNHLMLPIEDNDVIDNIIEILNVVIFTLKLQIVGAIFSSVVGAYISLPLRDFKFIFRDIIVLVQYMIISHMVLKTQALLVVTCLKPEHKVKILLFSTFAHIFICILKFRESILFNFFSCLINHHECWNEDMMMYRYVLQE